MANKKEQQQKLSITDLPRDYRKMLEPFPDGEAANTALQQFYIDLYELRNRYQLADVHVVVEFRYMRDGEEVAAMSSFHAGDPQHAERMAACALVKRRKSAGG